jgi:hypothetical protein
MDTSEEAATANCNAGDLESTAAALFALPGLTTNIQPWGVGMSIKLDAGNIAQVLLARASSIKVDALSTAERGAQASRKAQFIRQLQDRRMQANAAGREIKVVDKMIAAQQARITACDGDIRTQEVEIKNAAEVEEWLRTKYSSEELYGWLDNSFRTLFHRAFNLTSELAMKAEKAFRFERGPDDSTFLRPRGGYWDASHEGLLSADSMQLDLKRMELAYMEKRAHDFEVVKTVSLRGVQPWGLLTLRETGQVRFSLPEVLFDLDFPGHYCRRIKSIGVSVPCVIGPYTSLNATLTLQQHKYRISAIAGSAADYPEQPDGDLRFRTDTIPITSIAVSTAQRDHGVSVLDFHDERYLPFEGAGAISTWRLELPTAIRQFDYNTISDVVLHLRYTSKGAGVGLKNAASQAAVQMLKAAGDLSPDAGLCVAVDLKNDYSAAWSGFAAELASGKPASLDLGGLVYRFPFWARAQTIHAASVTVLFTKSRDEGYTAASDISVQVSQSETVALQESPTAALGAYTALENAEQPRTVGDWVLKVANGSAEKVAYGRMWLVLRYFVSTQ